MICHRHRLIFVHLRRTAGNSVEAALGGIRLFDRWWRRTDAWDNRLHQGKSWYKRDLRGHAIHATADEIRRIYPREFERYFRFSIVRNPWEQMASLYARLEPEDPEFEGFRNWLWRFNLARGTVPRASLFDQGGGCLVDVICRFERLQEDFDSVCDRISLPRKRLPQTNAATGRDLFEIYDDASVRLVERIFAEDIERFGHEVPQSIHRSVRVHRKAA